MNKCVSVADILCPAQEKLAHLDAARDPPRLHAHVRVVRREVHPGRSQHLLRPAQHLRAHRHVLLLLAGRVRAALPEVPVVEEVPHRTADGNYPAHITYAAAVSRR